MPPDEKPIVVGIRDITPTSRTLQDLPGKLTFLKALVSHAIAGLLVFSLCLSIGLYALCLGLFPGQGDVINTAFEKWYAVVSPFAGLALGAYYGSSRARRQEDGI